MARVLRNAGYALLPVAESGMCYGAAGTYSLLQPTLAERLRQRKRDHLLAEGPALIATANIGCLTHLQEAGSVLVRHWLELLVPEVLQE